MKRWMCVLATAAASGVVVGGICVGAIQREPLLILMSVLSLGGSAMAWMILANKPESPVAPALAWSSASVVAVLINDLIAASSITSDPLPAAALAAHWWVGDWPLNLAGTFALLLVFPGERDADAESHQRSARRWINRTLPWLFVCGSLLTAAGLWDVGQTDGRVADPPGTSPGPVFIAGFALVALSMVLAVIDMFRKYRSGTAVARRQIRWLMFAGTAVMLLLAGGWFVQQALGLPLAASYLPFLIAILVLLPVSVTVAVTRHDLFDVDWLLGESLVWLLSLLSSAALFAFLVFAFGRLLPTLDPIGAPIAAFAAALLLLPGQRLISTGIHRLVDPDSFRSKSLADQFTADVRSGRRQPEDVAEVLREGTGDPALRLLLTEVDTARWIFPDGTPTEPNPEAHHLDVLKGDELLARVELGFCSSRARRQVTQLAQSVSLPIAMCRLNVALRRANQEAVAMSTRLVEAVAMERVRLEHDLHDGVQMRIVGTGMRLRNLQPQLSGEAAGQIDLAVSELRETVAELRRVAHGIRPSRLEDGLAEALHSLRADDPVPVEVEVDELPELSEVQAATAYFVVAEAVTNALKHSEATSVKVRVKHLRGSLTLAVTDDGIGIPAGRRLVKLADRVASIGGFLDISEDNGRGTTVKAVVPCG